MSNVPNRRNDHEERLRQVVANQMAVHDELEKLRDEYGRLRRERDLLEQRCTHAEADLQMAKAERDHYMVQVATFLEQFNNTSAALCHVVDGFRAAAEAAVNAPFRKKQITNEHKTQTENGGRTRPQDRASP